MTGTAQLEGSGGLMEGDTSQLRADAIIADSVCGYEPKVPAGQQERVLVTGGTGFVGSFLVAELLSRGTRVDAVVRCPDAASGRERIEQTLRGYGQIADLDMSLLSVVPGDVTKPGLGIEDAAYRDVASRCDAIFHSAAKVNFLTPYKWLRKPMIAATNEILTFAQDSRAPLHHVSTLGVFAPLQELRVRGERDDTGEPGDIRLGYAKSKWVAEQMLWKAARRGVPVTVHRPAQVWGDSRTGACQRNDFVWRFLAGSLHAGVFPRRFRLAMNLVTVDYVAGSMVEISRNPDAINGVFHQVGPEMVDAPRMLELIRGAGYAPQEVSIVKWLRKISEDITNPMYPLLSTMMIMDEEDLSEFSDEFTRTFLDGTGISSPRIDQDIVDRQVDYFVGTGFLPARSQ